MMQRMIRLTCLALVFALASTTAFAQGGATSTPAGAVVDTSALPDALAAGHLAGAGIDVLSAEPPSEDDLLLIAWSDPNHPAYDRLIVNPHAAFYCEEGLMEIRHKASVACRQALLCQPLRNVVNGL